MWKDCLLIGSFLFFAIEFSAHGQQSIVVKAYKAIAQVIDEMERKA